MSHAFASRTVATLAVVAVVVTAGCSIPFLSPEPESFSGTYDYSFAMDANGTLSNVTVYVPLPTGPEGTPVNASVLAPNGSVDGAFTARVVDSEFGPVLELTAAEFEVVPRYYAFVERDGVGQRVEISEAEYDPNDPNHQKVDSRGVDVTVTLETAYPVETRDPVGAEPLLPVTSEYRQVDCETPTTDDATCYDHTTPVYLSYDASADTHVQAIVVFEGRNEWFAGGWTGNTYSDYVSLDVTGPQNGWVDADGTLLTGNGRYLD